MGQRHNVLIVVFVLSMLAGFMSEASAVWYDNDWTKRKQLTLNGQYIDSALVDFPTVIRMTEDEDLGNGAQADADDIVFALDNGTKLSHEIEYFNGDTLVAWVKIPNLPAAGLNFYVYYGNASVGDQSNGDDVWSSSYLGVYHLDEDPGGSAPQMLDSTAESTADIDSNDGTAQNMDSSNSTVAKIGNGVHLDGSVEYVQVNNDAGNNNVNYIKPSSAITMEIWVNADTWTPRDQGIFSLDNSTNVGWAIWDWAGSVRPIIAGGNSTDPYTNATHADSNFSTGVWYHVVATWATGGYARLYVNGAQVGISSSTVGGSLTYGTTQVMIGARGNAASKFDGYLDEARVAEVERSADWVKATFHSENGDVLTDIGVEELGGGGLGKAKVIIVTDASLDFDYQNTFLLPVLDDEDFNLLFDFGEFSAPLSLSAIEQAVPETSSITFE